MSGSFGFARAIVDLEARLVAELDLEGLAMPAELAAMEGRYRDRPVSIRARAYASPVIGYTRVATIEGVDLEIGNLLCLARPERRLPIFGVDLVGLGKDTGVVVADLSPAIDDGARSSNDALPAWARAWFSADALCLRVALDEARPALAKVSARADTFIDLARRSTVDRSSAPAIAARQAGYNAAHRDEDRGLQLLAKMFEPKLADRFLREVLFPESGLE